MAYNKVIFQGGLPGGEVWSCGLSFDSDGGEGIQDPEDLADFALAVGVLLAAVPAGNSIKNTVSTAVTFTGIRVEARAEDETLINFGEYTFPTALIGTSTPSKPFQTSLVLSLRTPTPGGSGRGRIYWPTLAIPLDSATLRVSGSIRTGFVTDWRAFINSIIAASLPGVVLHLIVRSVTFHVSRRVTVLQVGDIPDVQRRRRDSVVEGYTSLAFPA